MALDLAGPTNTAGRTRHLLAIAHRAGNRVADLRAALDAGVDLVEADVHLFRGALEVRHCKAVGRHVYWEWERREVALRRDRAVPELAEVLDAAQGDPRLMLDLKGPGLRVAGAVAGVLAKTAAGVPVTVCTKQWRMLDAFHAQPYVRRVFSAANRVQLRRLRARVRRGRVAGLSIRLGLLTPALVTELHRGADVVMAWPVDTPEALAHARRLGVSGVISKDLDLLRGVLATR
jgi:glycerophosphoryl diester phosphodiesterase